jgi:hypothetical protein
LKQPEKLEGNKDQGDFFAYLWVILVLLVLVGTIAPIVL